MHCDCVWQLVAKTQLFFDSHKHARNNRYPATLSGLQEFFDGIHEARFPQAGLGVPGHHGDSEGMYTCIVLDEFHKYFASMLQVLC